MPAGRGGCSVGRSALFVGAADPPSLSFGVASTAAATTPLLPYSNTPSLLIRRDLGQDGRLQPFLFFFFLRRVQAALQTAAVKAAASMLSRLSVYADAPSPGTNLGPRVFETRPADQQV